MNCDEYLPLISGHIDGVNSEIEECRLQEHLKTCEACRALLSQMEDNHAMLKRSLAAPPADLTARIMRQVRKEAPSSSQNKRWIPIAISGVAAAALLSLVFLGNLPFLGGAKAAMDAAPKEETGSSYDSAAAIVQSEAAESDLLSNDLIIEAPFDNSSKDYGFIPDFPTAATSDSASAEGTDSKRNPTRYTPSAPVLIVWDAAHISALAQLEPEDLNEYAPLSAPAVPSLYARYQAMIPVLHDFDRVFPDDGFGVTVFTVSYETMTDVLRECLGVYENAVYYPISCTAQDACSVVLIDTNE